ncbi:MAG: hypothetical protein AB1716_04230 [Planctomycetota bacterium]
MTSNEVTQTRELLAAQADRTETIGDGKGGQYITAYWRDGGQRLFYSLAAVREHLGLDDSLTPDDIAALAGEHEDARYEDEGEAAYGRPE